jgi:hypothetical protein
LTTPCTHDAKRGKDGDRTVASLYDLIPAAGTADHTKPIHPVGGDWNIARILDNGTHAEHWLNGVKALEYDGDSSQFCELIANSKFKFYPNFAGMHDTYIDLQDHGFPVSFRNIKVRELPHTPPKQPRFKEPGALQRTPPLYIRSQSPNSPITSSQSG